MDGLERRENAWTGATAHGFNQDAVTVVVVYDKNVIVARAGRDNEFAGLIGVDLSGGAVGDGSKTVVRACITGVADGETIGRGRFREGVDGVVGVS